MKRRETKTIPVVFAVVTDPVGAVQANVGFWGKSGSRTAFGAREAWFPQSARQAVRSGLHQINTCAER